MIRLRQTRGADTGREFEFHKPLVRIGRMPDSDIDFDPESDLDASGRHAEIRNEGDQYLLIDSGSRNGSWLNGERVKHAVLKPDDEIEFGRGGPKLVVVNVSHDPTQRAASPRTESKVAHEDVEEVPQTVQHHLMTSDQRKLAQQPGEPTLAPADQRGETVREQKPPFAYRPDIDFEFPPIGNESSPAAKGWRRPGNSRGRVHWAGLAMLLVSGLAVVGIWKSRPQGTAGATLTGPPLQALVDGVVSIHIQDGNTLCAGFFVRETVVTTTASCVARIQAAVRDSVPVGVAARDGAAIEIARMWRHPAFDETRTSPNIALIETAAAGTPLPLATRAGDSNVRSGLAIFGVAATGAALSSHIQSTESLASSEDTDAIFRYATLGAPPGTPLANANGDVIGIHVGPVPAASGQGDFAAHINLARGLLAGLGQ